MYAYRKKESHPCILCQVVVSSVAKLWSHIDNVHAPRSSFQCTADGCRKRFNSADWLYDHRSKWHLPECNVCGIQGTDKRAITEHMRRAHCTPLSIVVEKSEAVLRTDKVDDTGIGASFLASETDDSSRDSELVLFRPSDNEAGELNEKGNDIANQDSDMQEMRADEARTKEIFNCSECDFSDASQTNLNVHCWTEHED